MKAQDPRQRLVALEAPQHLAHITIHNANSPLFKLPGEIRNRIYEYVLGGKLIKIEFALYQRSARYYLSSSCLNPVEPDKVFDNGYSLPYTSRQLYLETYTLIYRLNILQFQSAWWAKMWSENRSAAQLIAIEDVKIYGPYGPSSKSELEQLAVVFPNLKRLR